MFIPLALNWRMRGIGGDGVGRGGRRTRVRGDSGDEEEDEDEKAREREIVLPVNLQRHLTGGEWGRYPKRDSNERGGL